MTDPVPGIEGGRTVTTMLVKRIGKQRTRRVVARAHDADGVPTLEILGCGHELRPPPKTERAYRVCGPCEERLGRVMARIGRDLTPDEADVFETERVSARSEIARLKRQLAKYKARCIRLERVMPRPRAGLTAAGRTVVEVAKSGVWWAPARVLKERLGNSRGIKHHATREEWAMLCTEQYVDG